MRRTVKTLVLFAAMLFLAGCQKMESGEYGVVFSKLPPGFPFYGGVRDRAIRPGEAELIFPWQEVYRFTTSVQTIGWGATGFDDSKGGDDYVETRALDGNEVGLAMTVQYRIDPERVSYIVQNVGIDDATVRTLVSSVARADIRTHMNTLSTSDFFKPAIRQAAIDQVTKVLDIRLREEGIIVERVQYNDHRFERRLPDGTIDRSYQQQIDATQAKNEETKQEENKVKTVIEEKNKELNEAQARVNRVVQEASGFKRQATLRGDGYLAAKKNEAAQISTVGKSEVEGLRKQIAALSGPGGRALLRLSIVKALTNANPRFVVVNPSGKGGGAVDVNRLDTNELLRQTGIVAGITEGLKESGKPTPKAALKSPSVEAKPAGE